MKGSLALTAMLNQRFLQAAAGGGGQSTCFKSIIRNPSEFDKPRNHFPKYRNGSGNWGEGGNHFLRLDRSPLDAYHPATNTCDSTTHEEIIQAAPATTPPRAALPAARGRG